MKKHLILFAISCPFLSLLSTQSIAADSETPKYTDEQLQKLKAAEEKYKDNPKIMKMISNIKENSGITDSVVEEKDSGPPPVMAHGEVITQGSHSQAKEAIKNKDYETAIANYKVLAAEGDADASLKLGQIYELQGDSGAAYTAYKQATESEDSDRSSKKAAERIKWFDRKGVTGDEEIEQANQLAEESPKTAEDQQSTTRTKTINNANQVQYRPVTTSLEPGVSQPIKSDAHYQSMNSRIVKITPQRVSKLEHFKPEKYIRTPKS